MSTRHFKTAILKLVLRNALTFERDTLREYEAVAAQCKESCMKDLLNDLLKEERHHIRHLEELTSDVQDGDTLETPAEEDHKDLHEAVGKLSTKTGCDLEHILELEESSARFYRALAAKTRIKAARKAFEFMAEEEERHAEKVFKMLESGKCDH